MSSIRGRDTKPEMVVRRWLWRQGFRYRLCVKALPGRPDIVMRKWRTVIFVNGCFWHGHECQNNRQRPATNARFWQEKLARNRARDERNQQLLQAAGWHVIVVWECQLSPKRRQQTLRDLDLELSHIVLRHNVTPAAKRYDILEPQAGLAAESTTPHHTQAESKDQAGKRIKMTK